MPTSQESGHQPIEFEKPIAVSTPKKKKKKKKPPSSTKSTSPYATVTSSNFDDPDDPLDDTYCPSEVGSSDLSSQVKQFYLELKSHNVTHKPTYIQHMYGSNGGNNNSERNIEKKVLEKR